MINDPFASQLLDPRAGALTSKDARQWGLLLHISQLAGFLIPFVGLIAPIVIWQIKKNEHPELDAHGKMAMNWILSSFLYMIVAGIASFVLIGIPVLLAILFCSIAFPIIAGVKANDGVLWKYPLTIPFVK